MNLDLIEVERLGWHVVADDDLPVDELLVVCLVDGGDGYWEHSLGYIWDDGGTRRWHLAEYSEEVAPALWHAMPEVPTYDQEAWEE